ncbi:tyrosine-type recombinase/integrase [Pseudochelatococcus sp. G4_1912]|uniref:tyrosine-type recombinase/integrase n=1 Tax=Pseudochelatococcus sp. G4_1912 TaxID=3114288 RepID=UPI0039C634E9
MAYHDTRYLKKHGNQWVVVVKVPDRLRQVVGKAHLKHPLHTDSLALANHQKHRIVADMKDQLAKAEKNLRSKSRNSVPPLIQEALDWRQHISAEDEDPTSFETFQDEGGNDIEIPLNLSRDLLADRAEEIERRDGEDKAKAFVNIATGSATPLIAVVDKWLAEKVMKPRQMIDYRRAVSKFDRWLAESKLPVTVEKITRRIAGRYVTAAFVETEANPRTANKDISCLSSLWKWLEIKEYVSANIWTRQSLEEPEPTKATAKRPYTESEIEALFKGNPSPLLRDFMAIAALSGMRIEEIARLTVEEVAGGWFDITIAKTSAGIRKVPIHSALQEIIDRRTKGKEPTSPLFPELPVPQEGSAVERSQKVVKQFTNYRRKIGVDDVPKGARQSRVDFHSLRRWFITKAEQAGQQPHFIEALVGHKRLGMSLGKYSAGPLKEQLRAVVESVRLPFSGLDDKISADSSSPIILL